MQKALLWFAALWRRASAIASRRLEGVVVEINISRTTGGMSATGLKMVCQDCGHVVMPGEPIVKCNECGGTNLKLEQDLTRTVTLQCAA